MHYKTAEDFLTKQGFSATILKRFWAKVRKHKHGCWEWIAARNAGGYGWIGQGPLMGRPFLAHRVSWMIHFGPIPKGIHVCHRCDNPPCCRPDHLFLGDDMVNQRDFFAKGRKRNYAHQTGETNAMARLTWEQIRTIRKICKLGHRGIQTRMARFYGVSDGCISMIVNMKGWKE